MDDDAGLRRLVQRALETRGFAVVTAESADEGLRLLRGEQFDLAAIDHTMPGKDGLAMLREIVALENSLPVVFVTGTDNPQVAVEALTSGATDFVIKTIGEDFFDLLAGRLTGALERVALERAKLAAEAELRAANDRLELLMREVHHRVANSLQIVNSFVSMQANQTKDDGARAALEETQHRIQAIATVHQNIYTRNDISTIDLDEYLEAIVAELRKSLAKQTDSVELRLNAVPVEVVPDDAISIGVIVTELVNNSVKYAFGENGGGTIEIALSPRPEGGFAVTVVDDGCGIGEGTVPRGTGLGMRIVSALARSLDTELERLSNGRGTCHRLAIPNRKH